MSADIPVRRHRRLWRGLAAGVALPVILLLLAWGLVNLPVIRTQLAGLLAAALSGEGLSVEIDRLEGPLPQSPRLIGLRVADADGVWLSVDRLRLDWRPLALLRGRLALKRIAVGTVRLDRLPAAQADSSPSGLPRLPLSIALDRLSVDRVDLGAPVLGEAAAFAVEGRAASRAGAEVASSLRLARLDGVAGAAVLSAALNAESGRLEIEANVEEPGGGLVASLLGLPGRPPLSISLAGAGTIDDWQGSLRAAAADLGAIDAKVRIDARGPIVADVRGSTDLSMPLPAPALRLLGDHVDFQAVAAWDAAAYRLALRELSLTARAVAVTAQGQIDAESLETRLDVAARLLESAAVGELLPGATAAGAEATVAIGGPLFRPAVDLTLRLAEPAAEGASAATVTLQSRLRPDRDLTAPGLRIGIDGSLGAEGLAGLPPLAAGTIGESLAASWSASVDVASGVVEVASLDAASGALRGEASGTLDPGGEGDLGLTLRLDDVAPLARGRRSMGGCAAGAARPSSTCAAASAGRTSPPPSPAAWATWILPIPMSPRCSATGWVSLPR